MSVIVCTICSREKDESEESMPAHKRYRGDHIDSVRAVAEAACRSYYILSGKFGLLKASDLVPCYDFRLTPQDVRRLSFQVSSKLSQDGVTEVVFYTKPTRAWMPYQEVMKLACERNRITLRIVHA